MRLLQPKFAVQLNVSLDVLAIWYCIIHYSPLECCRTSYITVCNQCLLTLFVIASQLGKPMWCQSWSFLAVSFRHHSLKRWSSSTTNTGHLSFDFIHIFSSYFWEGMIYIHIGHKYFLLAARTVECHRISSPWPGDATPTTDFHIFLRRLEMTQRQCFKLQSLKYKIKIIFMSSVYIIGRA